MYFDQTNVRNEPKLTYRKSPRVTGIQLNQWKKKQIWTCSNMYFPPSRMWVVLQVMHFTINFSNFAWCADVWNWIALNNTINMPHITRMENIWLKPRLTGWTDEKYIFVTIFSQIHNVAVFLTSTKDQKTCLLALCDEDYISKSLIFKPRLYDCQPVVNIPCQVF